MSRKDGIASQHIVPGAGLPRRAWQHIWRSLTPRTEAEAAIVANQLRIARDGSNLADALTPLTACIVAYAMRGWIEAPVLLGWVATVTLICLAINLAAARLYPRLDQGVDIVRKVARLRTAMSAVLLIAWCSMTIVLWVPGSIANHMILVFVLAVSLAASASILAAHPAGAAIAFLITGGSLIVRPLLDGGRQELMLAGIGAMFTILMLNQARAIYRMAKHGHDLEFRCHHTLRLLAKAKAEANREHVAAIEAGQAKSSFLSNMSHELRTPMNAILGFSELIETRVLGDKIEKYAEYASLIHQSGDHLLALINDMFDLSKIEGGRLTLEESVFSLRALVEGTAAEYNAAAPKHQIMLHTKIDSALPEVEADRRAICHILRNLLSNALKFTPPGGHVTVVAKLEPDGRALIAVEDTGIGIAPKDQTQVFERFGNRRHDVTVSQQGTGLGLAIVKGYAEAHGGEVTLDSAPGIGTRVAVRLPAARVHKIDMRAAE